MPTATLPRSVPIRAVRQRIDLSAIAIWVLAFALPAYLALEGGGYDGVVRGQLGIAVWWAVIVGAICGVVPRAPLTRAAWLVIGALAAFTAWTLLSAAWSSSGERSVFEASRVAMHLGVLVLAVASVGPRSVRHVVNALAAAVGVVGALALLSRLHPGWFPAPETGEFLPNIASRLAYPLNYWNALGAFLSLGVPLLLYVATAARSLAGRALAAGALPLVVSALYLTYSRGAMLAGVVAVVVLVAIWPARWSLIGTIAVVGAGSGILAASVARRSDLADGLPTELARQQGDQVLLLSAVVIVGCALLQTAVALLDRYATAPAWLRPSPRTLLRSVVIGVLACVAAAAVAGGPQRVSHGWHRFKDPRTGLVEASSNSSQRLTVASGKGRYQMWDAAVRAARRAPVNGIGAGTFEFWWAEHGGLGSFVRNAHSLWFESLAELGIVGLALLVVVFVTPFVSAVTSLRRGDGDRRLLGAALAGLAAFVVSVSFDWIWQVTAVPVAALILAATLVAARPGTSRRGGSGVRVRAGFVGMGLVALVVIALPLAGLVSVRQSQAEAQRSDLAAALQDVSAAKAVQPYAGTPLLQEALLNERLGRLDAAVAAARRATEAEQRNWRTWIVLSRLEAERGRATAAVSAYRRARALNPRSPFFTQ